MCNDLIGSEKACLFFFGDTVGTDGNQFAFFVKKIKITGLHKSYPLLVADKFSRTTHSHLMALRDNGFRGKYSGH